MEIFLFCLAGPLLVPLNEQLLITKVDECGRTSTFIHSSNPVKDTITDSEFQEINNFVARHSTHICQISVLWLLSEFVMKKFGEGRW